MRFLRKKPVFNCKRSSGAIFDNFPKIFFSWFFCRFLVLCWIGIIVTTLSVWRQKEFDRQRRYFNIWRRYEEAQGLVFFYAFLYIFHRRTLAFKIRICQCHFEWFLQNWYDKYNLKLLYGGGFCLFVTRSRMNRLRGWSNPPDRISTQGCVVVFALIE